MSNRVLIDQIANTVTAPNYDNRNVVVVNAERESHVEVVETVSNIVEIIVPGPQGQQGPQGPQGDAAQTSSLLTTSSFNEYTGSTISQFNGTASYALTASYLEGYISPFPFTGSAVITGSLILTGSLSIASLRSGSVLFSSGSTISQDNANFFWDDANNRLGIGNNSPTYPLDVTGVIRGSADAIINGLTVGKGFTNNDSATAFGFEANSMNTSLFAMAFGYQALKNNTSGNATAIGYQAAFTNTTAQGNTAIGYQSLYSNNAGFNTAVGSNCMTFSTGAQNSGFGYQALDNVTGTFNVGMGYRSLRFLTSGTFNTAVGGAASNNIGTGNNNVSMGYAALGFGTPGNANSNNVAIGYISLWQVLGNNNTALGFQAGRYIANGSTAATSADNSILIGYNTKVLANSQTNQIVIGYDETGLGSNTTIIGNSSTVTTAIRGNLLLGTTTDAGNKLDVIGATRFTGNSLISGSLTITGSLIVPIITGSLFGTSSWAQSASVAPNYLPLTGGTITGSLTINNNLIVLGSASIQYISESTLNIGTNLITVNTINPAVRFGGLAVIDSGSSPRVSASFLYDSIQDEFLFVHKGRELGATTSSVFLLGPETYNNIGNETYLTANRIPKGAGNEHLNDSSISDNGSIVSINSNTQITGSLLVTAGITGSFSGSGANLNSIPASAITGLNLSQISSGSVSASISEQNGLQVNTNVTATSFTGSLFGTSSWASNAQTASYVLNAVSSSFATTASYIDPIFISASAAAAGFGSGLSPSLAIAYAIALG